MKKFKRDLKGRFARKSKKVLLFLLMITIALGGYYSWAMNYPDYAHAEVNFKKNNQIDQRTIQEHVWDIMTNEYDLTFSEKIKAMSVIDCESRFNNWAIGDGGKSLGLWQIHLGFHPDVTPEQAFDVYASTRWAIEKALKDGKGKPVWSAWTCGR